MSRPDNDEYYYPGERTKHVSQGDIFRNIVFSGPGAATLTTYGMLLHYTSNMMNGAPGTPGYAHDSRLLAPIYEFEILADLGLSVENLRGMQAGDKIGRYLYLPPYPDAFAGSGVVLYRAERFTQPDLEGKRTKFPAAQQLQRKLARVFFGMELEDPAPDMTDHWTPPN